MVVSTVPRLLSFDIFGTVVDWRRGLSQALARQNLQLGDADFEAVIDDQGRAEQGPLPSYANIDAASLVNVLGVDSVEAVALGAAAGRWPLYPDAREGLSRLLAISPCIATTNSDRAHQAQVEEQLGFRLSHWFSAEEIGCYKPDPSFFGEVARRLGRV